MLWIRYEGMASGGRASELVMLLAYSNKEKRIGFGNE
jgi:hypothetical protein